MEKIKTYEEFKEGAIANASSVEQLKKASKGTINAPKTNIGSEGGTAKTLSVETNKDTKPKPKSKSKKGKSKSK